MNPTSLPPNGTSPHHSPTRDEIFELGLLAVEDTPDEVVHPHAAGAAPPAAPAPVVATMPAPALVAPSATPSRAAPVAPPKPSQPPPSLDLSKPKPAPVASSAGKKMVVVDRMDLSANSMHIRSLGKLRFLNSLLYLLILAMALGVVFGGWVIYKHLAGGGSLF